MKQEEIDRLYFEELKKEWDDAKMVEYCKKNTALVVEHGGMLYPIERPSIETSFWYGYGWNGRSSEEEEAWASASVETALTSEEHFIEHNLEDLNRTIAKLNEALDGLGKNWVPGDHPRFMVVTGRSYAGDDGSTRICYATVVDTFRPLGNAEPCFDKTLVRKMIAGYEEVREGFVKRLRTYLKRYGLSKISVNTYLRD